jgi:hypothetical protein
MQSSGVNNMLSEENARKVASSKRRGCRISAASTLLSDEFFTNETF